MTEGMKKMLILVFLIALGGVSMAQSRTIKTGPAGIPFGYVSICYEKALNDNSSFQLSLVPYNKVKDYDGTAFGAGIDYRVFITKKEVLKGFYISPGASFTFGNLTETESAEEFQATAIHFTANLGYQWIWGNGFLVDLALGPKYSLGQGDNVASEFDGTHPDVRFGVGFVF